MEIWVYGLMAAWIWHRTQHRVAMTPAYTAAKWVLTALIAWLAFGALQFLPLPAQFVRLVSPDAYSLREPLAALGDSTHPGWLTLSTDPYASTVEWMKGLAYVLVFVLTLLLTDSQRKLRMLAYAIVFSALFQAVYGSLMTLSGIEYGFFHEKWAYRGFATGTFINRNHFAEYLVLGLSVGIGLLISGLRSDSFRKNARQRLQSLLKLLFSSKMRLRIYLAVMVVALVLTRSRMGNSAFFVSLFVAGVLVLILARRHATRSTIFLLSSLVIIDMLILGAWFGIDKVAQRLEETTLATEARTDVTRYGISMWRDYPLIGSGGGSFYSTFPRYRGQDVIGFYQHAHNEYIQILIEYGVIGASFLAAAVVMTFGASVLALRRRRNHFLRGMAFSATMAITAISIHSLVEFNLQIPAIAVTFMSIMALAWIALVMKSQETADARRTS